MRFDFLILWTPWRLLVLYGTLFVQQKVSLVCRLKVPSSGPLTLVDPLWPFFVQWMAKNG